MKYRVYVKLADNKFLDGYVTTETAYQLDNPKGPVKFGNRNDAREFVQDDVHAVVQELLKVAKERKWTVWHIGIEGIL